MRVLEVGGAAGAAVQSVRVRARDDGERVAWSDGDRSLDLGSMSTCSAGAAGDVETDVLRVSADVQPVLADRSGLADRIDIQPRHVARPREGPGRVGPRIGAGPGRAGQPARAAGLSEPRAG